MPSEWNKAVASVIAETTTETPPEAPPEEDGTEETLPEEELPQPSDDDDGEEKPPVREEAPSAVPKDKPKPEKAEKAAKPKKEAPKTKEAPPEEPETDKPSPEPVEASDDHVLTLDVDGKKIKKTVGEIRRDAQKVAFADEVVKRTRKAEEELHATRAQFDVERKQLDEAKKSLLKDPLGTFEDILSGMVGSPERAHALAVQAAAELIMREDEISKLSPDQRQMMSEKRRLELEAQRLREEAAQHKAQQQVATTEHTKKQAIALVQRGIQSSGLPDNEIVFRAIGEKLLTAYNTGVSLTPEQAADMVKGERQKLLTNYLESGVPREQLIQAFPEYESQIRQHALQSAKQHPTTKVPAAQAEQSPQPTQKPRRETVPKPFGTLHEYRRYIDSITR